jgi:hypothetical protein
MKQDEIIEMAMEANFVSQGNPSREESELFVCTDKDIVHFAALVAAKEREKWSEVEAYLIAASEGSMSRNNSEALANELLIAIREME